MIISHKYKFIFIKTRKTAGTSIERYLTKFCNKDDVITPRIEGDHVPQNHKGYFNPFKDFIINRKYIFRIAKDFILKNKFYHHIPACLVKSRVPGKVWDNYYKFCFERNPWDKTISHFYMLHSQSKGRLTFDKYIAEEDFCHDYNIYTDPLKHNKIIVDYVAKYENLSSELSRIFAHLGVPFDGNLNVFAKGQYRKDKRPYQTFFSDKDKHEYKEIIEEEFKKEIKMHGYKFE